MPPSWTQWARPLFQSALKLAVDDGSIAIAALIRNFRSIVCAAADLHRNCAQFGPGDALSGRSAGSIVVWCAEGVAGSRADQRDHRRHADMAGGRGAKDNRDGKGHGHPRVSRDLEWARGRPPAVPSIFDIATCVRYSTPGCVPRVTSKLEKLRRNQQEGSPPPPKSPPASESPPP